MKPHTLAVLAAALVSSGCTSIPSDRGFADVDAALAERGMSLGDASPDAPAPPLNIDQHGELTAANAVRIALANNPQLKTTYARLGVAAADVYDAARPSNPSLSLGVLGNLDGGTAAQITASLMQSIAEIILLKPREQLAALEFETVKHNTGAALFNLAQDVEMAWLAHLAARETAALSDLAAEASELAATLSQRYFDAGNINRLDLAVAESAVSEMQLKANLAGIAVAETRLALNALLGVAPQTQWTLPPRLTLPGAPPPVAEPLVELALATRLDLKAAELAETRARDALEVTRRYRLLGDLQAGAGFERESDGPRLLGPQLTLELPIFNQGAGRVLRDTSSLEGAEATSASLRNTVAYEVSVAHARLLAAHERLRLYRERFLPSRQAIVARTREMQNYMFVGPFESLRVKTAEYDASAAYIAAARDCWLAQIALARAVGTALPIDGAANNEPLELPALRTPRAAEHEHHEHSAEGAR